jgi:hypothetical protein
MDPKKVRRSFKILSTSLVVFAKAIIAEIEWNKEFSSVYYF